MGLSSYMEDGNEEMKADLVKNWPHIWREWWNQVKGL